MLGGLLSTFALAFVLNAFSKTRAPSTVAIGATVLGTAWIGSGLGALVLLREEHHKARLLAFTVLLTVWATDTFAYFAGRLFGRHKLAPQISPNKSWEGSAGSLAGSLLIAVFLVFLARSM